MSKIARINGLSLLLALGMFNLSSCGGSKSSSNSAKNPSTTPDAQELRQNDEGIYRSILKPINTNVAGNTTSGNMIIKIFGDDMVVKGRIVGSPAGVMHRQQIRVMKSCPSATADKNIDSYIDSSELAQVSGPVLIPLDRDISEQMNGIGFGPIANASGVYVYKTSSPLTRLLADLRDIDPDKQDDMVKLLPEQNLNLHGKQIVIFGVANDTQLPATVSAMGELNQAQSLPIACGELVRITSEEAATVSVETPTVEVL